MPAVAGRAVRSLDGAFVRYLAATGLALTLVDLAGDGFAADPKETAEAAAALATPLLVLGVLTLDLAGKSFFCGVDLSPTECFAF